jgi:hypothetical protein
MAINNESRASRRPVPPGFSGWLGSACFALAGMFRRVLLARFLGVIRGMQKVPMRKMRLMRGLFVTTGFVMFGRFTMMTRGEFVLLGCALVMLRAFMFRHYQSPWLKQKNCDWGDFRTDRQPDPDGVQLHCSSNGSYAL